MTLSDRVLTVLVLLSLGIAVATAAVVAVRAIRETRSPSSLPPDKRIEAELGAQAKAIKRLEAAVRQLSATDRQLHQLSQESIRHVGVVRFDAFEDMGGRLSFSAALLDAGGDGVVITSINGRQESRCYAKPVTKGGSVHNLSDEEQQAIREALGSGRQVAQAR
ncbi:MAG TPA: DUF4446 family protein [Actinomycetota bacterium]